MSIDKFLKKLKRARKAGYKFTFLKMPRGRFKKCKKHKKCRVETRAIYHHRNGAYLGVDAVVLLHTKGERLQNGAAAERLGLDRDDWKMIQAAAWEAEYLGTESCPALRKRLIKAVGLGKKPTTPRQHISRKKKHGRRKRTSRK